MGVTHMMNSQIIRLALLVATMLMALPACRTSTPTRAERPRATTSTIARLQPPTSPLAVTETARLFRGRDGIRLALTPDPNANLVGIHVRYGTGSAADPADKAGLAHVAEHATFEFRRNPESPTLIARLRQESLSFNGFTSWNTSDYFAVGFPDKLEVLLDIEVDRMHWDCGQLDRDDIAREREIVARELILKHANRTILDIIRRAFFDPEHPYYDSPGGSQSELMRISAADVCGFIRANYVPDNAALIVSGRFDIPSGKRLLERHFGPLVEVAEFAPREPREVSAHEDAAQAIARRKNPPRSAAAGISEIASPGTYPAFMLIVNHPAADAPSKLDYRFAMWYLNRRISARIRRDQSLLDAGVVNIGGERGGAHGIYIQTDSEEALGQAQRLLDDLTQNPFFGVDGDEFAAAKKRFQADLLHRLDTMHTRANVLAARLFHGPEADIGRMLTDADKLAVADIESLIRRIAKESHKIKVLPSLKTSVHNADSATDVDDNAANTDDGATVANGYHSIAPHIGDERITSAADTVSSPNRDALEAQQDLPLPAILRHRPIVRMTLRNGLHVILEQRPSSPITRVELAFAGGRGSDPAALVGLSEFAASLRTPGVNVQWTPTLADDLAAAKLLPIDIDTDVDHRATVFHGTAPTSYLSSLLWNLSLHVQHGGYVDVGRAQKLFWRFFISGLARHRSRLLGTLIEDIIVGTGTDESRLDAMQQTVANLNADVLNDYAARHYRPELATLVISGGFEPGPLKADLEALFGGWEPVHVAAKAQQDSPVTIAQPKTTAIRPTQSSSPHRIIFATDRQGPVKAVLIWNDFAKSKQPEVALVARALIQVRLLRELREKLAATYHVTASLQGDALIIETELSGPNIDTGLARIEAILRRLPGDNIDSDFVAARRDAVKAVIANTFTTAGLRDDHVYQSIDDHSHSDARGDNDVSPSSDALISRIAKLRPSYVTAYLADQTNIDAIHYILVAPKVQGQRMFRAMGAEVTQVIEQAPAEASTD